MMRISKTVSRISLSVLLMITLPAGIVFPATADSLRLPDNGFADGWAKSGEAQKFSANDLYGHINGGAELFLEFGFIDLLVQRYTDGRHEIGLELYRMDSPTAALGIYLMKCGKEMADPELPGRNTVNNFQTLMILHNYYIQVINAAGDSSVSPVIKKIYRRLSEGVGKPMSESEMLQRLPQEFQIPGRLRLFRGPYALQAIFTFGEGDVFLQRGSVFGVCADYQNGSQYTQLLIVYQSATDAAAAFRNFAERHDDLLNVVEKDESQIMFRDYRQKFGWLKIILNELHIKIGLDKPGQ
jgi:hypothetical protein